MLVLCWIFVALGSFRMQISPAKQVGPGESQSAFPDSEDIILDDQFESEVFPTLRTV